VQLRNDQGTAVDPVPFLVVGASAFLVCFSFGPIYLGALGIPLQESLVVSGVVCVATTALAYHRLVRRARPEIRTELSPEARLKQLFYVTLLLTLVTMLLAVPLLL
jgi:hypothetical protein